MSTYKYAGRDGRGVSLTGTIEADSQQVALQELTRRGYFITELGPDRDLKTADFKPASLKVRLGLEGKVTVRDLGLLARQLGVLYAAGIPILPALGAIREQVGDATPLGASIMRIEEALNRGESLTLALREDPIFPPIFVNMVAAGEIGGSLDEALLRAAAYFEREYEIGQKVKSALTYPKFIAVVAVAVSVFLLATVVPNFVNVFAGFDAELPAITRMVFGFSQFVTSWGWLLLLLAVAAYFVYRAWHRTQRGQETVDKFMLKAPIFGKMITLNAISRFCRTLAVLVRSGIHVVGALQLAEQTVGNSVYTNAIREAADAIGRGSRLSTELTNTGLFPPMVLHMVQAGESSGGLDSMLDQVADFYDQDLNNLTDRMGKLIEPVILMVMALVVGIMALAIMLPLMSMGDVIQF